MGVPGMSLRKILETTRVRTAVGLLSVALGWTLAAYSIYVVSTILYEAMVSGVSSNSGVGVFSAPILALGVVMGASFAGQNGIAFLLGLAFWQTGAVLLQNEHLLSHRIAVAPSTANLLTYIVLGLVAVLSLLGA